MIGRKKASPRVRNCRVAPLVRAGMIGSPRSHERSYAQTIGRKKAQEIEGATGHVRAAIAARYTLAEADVFFAPLGGHQFSAPRTAGATL